MAVADDFKVYKTYGTVREARKKDILVGYDIQNFVVEDKRICAALLVKSFDARNIRVLLMDTGFKSIFHDTVTLKCQVPMKVTLDDYEFTVEAGEKFTIFDGDERLRRADRRFIVEPEESDTVDLCDHPGEGAGHSGLPGQSGDQPGEGGTSASQ